MCWLFYFVLAAQLELGNIPRRIGNRRVQLSRGLKGRPAAIEVLKGQPNRQGPQPAAFGCTPPLPFLHGLPISAGPAQLSACPK